MFGDKETRLIEMVLLMAVPLSALIPALLVSFTLSW